MLSVCVRGRGARGYIHVEENRARGWTRTRARRNERTNERTKRTTWRGGSRVGKSRLRVPSYRCSAPTERNCLLRHGGVPRGTKCIRLVPVLVNHMERAGAGGGMEGTRDRVDADVGNGRTIRLARFSLARRRPSSQDARCASLRSSGVCAKGSLGTKARMASSSSSSSSMCFAFARPVAADVLARHPRTGRARAATIGDAAHDTDGVPALPARRWEERTARRSSRRVGDALGETHARAPAPTANARVETTRAGAAAERGAHANMSGRCLEDAPSGARVCQSARAADQATFRLVVDDARRASTGPTARSLVGGECAGVGIASRENLESVAAGHFRPTARRPDRENTAVSPVCCRCSDTHERAFATSAARRIVLTPGSSRPRRRAARHHPELAPRPVASVDEACARWLDI